MGRGFAGGLVCAGEDCWGEGAVGRAVAFWVVGRELGEAGDGLGAGERFETGGLFLGGCGEAVEDLCYLWGFEQGEELADGEVVAGGDVGEGDVASEVVVEDGGELKG